MFKALAKLPVSSILLTGCALQPTDFAQTPVLPSKYGVNVASVIHSAKCEISQEVQKIRSIHNYQEDYPFLDTWYAEATFTLETEHYFDANGDPTFVVPFANFTLNGSGGLKASRSSKTTSTITVPFNLDGMAKNCTPQEIAKLNEDNKDENVRTEIVLISGVIGLRKWIAEINDSLSAINVDPKTLGYTAEFEVIHTASAGATFTPLTAFDDNFGGKLGLSGRRKVAHKIDISTAKIEKQKKGTVLASQAMTQAENSVTQMRLFNAIQNSTLRD